MKKYMRVENKKAIRFVGGKPNWFNSDGQEITDDTVFIQGGIYPLDDAKPEYDPKTQRIKAKSMDEWIVHDDHVEKTWDVIDKSLDEVKQERLTEIEQERTRRTELMPYTTPVGTDVEVKLKEESPNKPRQTWLSGKANKADSRIRRNLDMDDVDGDKYLIAADDSRHEMTADDWLDLGEKMDSWITGHVFAASQHMQAVKDLETVQEVIDYDFSDGWPS